MANYRVHVPYGVNNWRIPHIPLEVPIYFAEYMVIVCDILYNFDRKNNSCNLDHILYVEGLLDIPNSLSQREGRIANYVRCHFANYFVKNEEVHWPE
jgi:hypothetical protein